MPGILTRPIIFAALLLCAASPSRAADAPPVDAASGALQAGNASNALALATQALAAGNLTAHDRARLLIECGLAHEMLGERDDALLDYTQALDGRALAPAEEALGLYDRGVTLDELSRTEDAIGDYSAAIRIEPTLSSALNNRGNAYRRLGRLAEARRDYEASIAAGNPHREYPDFGLGQIAEASENVDAARGYYQAALATNPDFGPAKERVVALGASADAGDAPIVLRSPGEGAVHLRPPRSGRPRVAAPPAIDAKALPLRSALNEGPAGGDGGILVQLGAWRSQGEAALAWSRIARVAAKELVGLTPQVVTVDLPGKGRFFRLRTSPGDKGASGLCSALRAKGLACLVVKD